MIFLSRTLFRRDFKREWGKKVLKKNNKFKITNKITSVFYLVHFLGEINLPLGFLESTVTRDWGKTICVMEGTKCFYCSIYLNKEPIDMFCF